MPTCSYRYISSVPLPNPRRPSQLPKRPSLLALESRRAKPLSMTRTMKIKDRMNLKNEMTHQHQYPPRNFRLTPKLFLSILQSLFYLTFLDSTLAPVLLYYTCYLLSLLLYRCPCCLFHEWKRDRPVDSTASIDLNVAISNSKWLLGEC
jgi:hypothetical protein